MTFNILIALLYIIIFSSCAQHKFRRIIVDDLIAEGDISKDTVYNGDIKFYDTTSNKIVIYANYKNGKLDGKRIDYYLNGNLQHIGYWHDGKRTGIDSFYDSNGKLSCQQEYYYGLEVGSTINYKNGKANEYYFSSFENETLFYLNYDSLYNKETKQLNDNRFFFYHINSFAGITTTDKSYIGKEYFIYLINPPNLNFEYSLCVINTKDSVLRTEKKFGNTNPWDTFILDSTKLDKGERFTLRLNYERDINEDRAEKGDMRKRL